MDLELTEDRIPISADRVVTGRTCVIGQSGSGKSYTVAVICEELARNSLGFCIIDTEGEYFSLKDKFTLLWVGSDPNSDIDIEQVNLKTLAEKAVKEGVSVVFDVSDVLEPKKKVAEFIAALYATESKLKQPYLLIVEEIDKFAPQSGEMLKEIDEVARRGRKRGLGLMIATQRPALVNKNILSQCGNQVIGKLTINNDLDAVKIFFPKRIDLEKLPNLKPGEFFLQGDFVHRPAVTKIRQRQTPHKAVTPKVIARQQVGIEQLKRIEADIEERTLGTSEEAEVEEVRKLTVMPKVEKSKAFETIKRSTRRFLGLGKESPVSGFHLVLYPVFECKVGYVRKKFFSDRIEDTVVYFDGMDGNVLDLSKGFKVRFDFSKLKGLDRQEVQVLSYLKKDATSSEIEHFTNLSESAVRSSLQKLSDKKLIGSTKRGKSKVYFRLTDFAIPGLNNLSSKLIDFEEQKLSAGTLKPDVDAKQLNNLIKSVADKAELLSQRIVYYPLYKATVLEKKRSRTRFVDAITGKLLDIRHT